MSFAGFLQGRGALIMSFAGYLHGRAIMIRETGEKSARAIVETIQAVSVVDLVLSECHRHGQLWKRACQSYMIGAETTERNFLQLWLLEVCFVRLIENICSESIIASQSGLRRLQSLSKYLHFTSQCSESLYHNLRGHVLLPFSFHLGENHVQAVLGSAKGFMHTVLVAPVLEELVYRQFACLALSLVFRRHQETVTEEKGTPPSRTAQQQHPQVFGITPFNAISSILFGLLHVGNHTDKLPRPYHLHRGNMEKVCREALIPAMAQSFLACWNSLFLFTPLFERHGIVASIAAHMTWNLIVTSKFFYPFVAFQCTRYWHLFLSDETTTSSYPEHSSSTEEEEQEDTEEESSERDSLTS